MLLRIYTLTKRVQTATLARVITQLMLLILGAIVAYSLIVWHGDS